MKLKKYRIVPVTALLSAVLMAGLHNASLQLGWYYLYPYIDIPIHIIGGFSVGLLVYLVLIRGLKKYTSEEITQSRQLYIMVFGTLIVAVVWEVLELVFYLTNDAGLSKETLSDIIFGVVGAVLAWIFLWCLPVNKKPHQEGAGVSESNL